MRTGKSRIVIDAAQFLFERDVIDSVLVVAPFPVLDVWYDPVLGEIAKHSWHTIPATIDEFRGRHRSWFWGDPRETVGRKRLHWTVTNYEFIRSKRGSKLKRNVEQFPKVQELLEVCTNRTMLVLDESSFVKSWDAAQTQAVTHLRQRCGRVVLLNGTPISHSPKDLFSQGNLLHPGILQCGFITHFEARYAVKEPVLTYGGKPLTKVVRGGREITIQKTVGWRDLDDLQRRFAPHTVRRLQSDCPDMPTKLDPVVLTATLTSPTWKAYKDMRDEMVVWLQSGDVASAQTAAVKAMRLSQITGGFVGGIEDARIEAEPEEDLLDSLVLGDDDGRGSVRIDQEGFSDRRSAVDGAPERIAIDARDDERTAGDAQRDRSEHLQPTRPVVTVLGREKLDVVLWKLEQMFEADANAKVVVWFRFRQELERFFAELTAKFGDRASLAKIHGGQKKEERTQALSLLHPKTTPNEPVIVAGTLGTGSFGLNFSAASTAIFASFDYSLGKYLQAADRIYGPGAQRAIAYFDVVAVGPKGQRTIDHAIVAARRNNEEIATWTSAAWIKALTEE